MSTQPLGSTKSDLIALLFQALDEPIGLVARASDRDRARQKLYSVRKELESEHEALRGLQIRLSPENPHDLWIIKSKVTSQGEKT